MKFIRTYTTAEIKSCLDAEIDRINATYGLADGAITADLTGNPGREVASLCGINNLDDNAVIYVGNNRYLKEGLDGLKEYAHKISCIITTDKLSGAGMSEHLPDVPLIVTSHPKLCFSLLTRYADTPRICMDRMNEPERKTAVHPGARVSADAYICSDVEIGADSVIYPDVFIGGGTRIGRNVTIYPNVTIYGNAEIGNNVIIHSGTVIGADGYAYEQVLHGNSWRHIKVEHVGKVVIKDHVEIGANTCIDRAFIETTTIGEGTKIDNQVQIGHNVTIGDNCIIVAQVAIAGNTVIEDNVVLFGQVGVIDNVTVGSGAVVTGGSSVLGDIPRGRMKWAGYPAKPARHEWRNNALLENKLPALIKAVTDAGSFEEMKAIFDDNKK